MPDPWTDSDHLLREQYQDGSRLLARQNLHRDFSTSRVGWQEWLFERLRLPDGAEILEVGCGRGQLWWDNRDSLPRGLNACITDLSQGMVDECRQRLTAILPGASFAVADAQHLEYGDGSFDFVLAHHMLYHLPNRSRAVSEFWRVLRPGGLLLAATNGPGHMKELRRLARSVIPDKVKPGPSDPEFNLENGPSQLKPWFAGIRVSRRRDFLKVTGSAPLVGYVRSLIAGQLSDSEIELFEARVNHAIARDGYFGIETEAGLLRGRRRQRAPSSG